MSNKPKLQTIVVNLEIPINGKDESGVEKEIDKLVLHRMKVKDLEKLPDECFEEGNRNPKYAVPLIAAFARESADIIRELDLVDLGEVMEKLSPFLPKSQKTGKK